MGLSGKNPGVGGTVPFSRGSPHPGTEPTSPALAGGFFTTETPENPLLLTSETLKAPFAAKVSPGHEAGSERARASVPRDQWWTVKTSPGSHHRSDGGQKRVPQPTTCASLRPTRKANCRPARHWPRPSPACLQGMPSQERRTCLAWALAVATAAQASRSCERPPTHALAVASAAQTGP